MGPNVARRSTGDWPAAHILKYRNLETYLKGPFICISDPAMVLIVIDFGSKYTGNGGRNKIITFAEIGSNKIAI
jgi:hypothetical protein